MSACEKCWSEACEMSYHSRKDRMECYVELLMKNDGKCTPKEQAGQWWSEEKQCDIRNFGKLKEDE